MYNGKLISSVLYETDLTKQGKNDAFQFHWHLISLLFEHVGDKNGFRKKNESKVL